MTAPSSIATVEQQDLERVLAGLLEASQAEDRVAFAAIAATPVIQGALEHVRDGAFDGFYYALQHPWNQALDGLLASALPESEDARFLFKHTRFVSNHVRRLIETYEGPGCSADKSATVLRALLRWLTTGQVIEFDYTQQYTFHLPQRVFCDHATTVQFFMALRSLYYGRPEPYLQALSAVQVNLRDEATEQAGIVGSRVASTNSVSQGLPRDC